MLTDDKRPARRGHVLMVFLAVALMLASGHPADAGFRARYDFDGVNIRTGPSTSYTSIGLGYTTHDACWNYTTSGEPINGNSTWVNHKNLTTGVGPGFSNESFMSLVIPGEGCAGT